MFIGPCDSHGSTPPGYNGSMELRGQGRKAMEERYGEQVCEPPSGLP